MNRLNVNGKMMALLLGLLILIGCARRTIIREYYVLELPPAADSTEYSRPALVDGACNLLPIQVAAAYDQTRIAVRTASHQLNYYVYHEWAVNPGTAFTELAEDFLRRRHLFAEISTQIVFTAPAYRISGTVYHLEAMEEKGRLLAHLSAELRLMDNQAGKMAVQHSFDRTVRLPRKNINSLAANLSEIFQNELTTFAGKMRRYLEQRQSPPAVSDGKLPAKR